MVNETPPHTATPYVLFQKLLCLEILLLCFLIVIEIIMYSAGTTMSYKNDLYGRHISTCQQTRGFAVLMLPICRWMWERLKKVKVAHTRLPSVGFRSWSRFLTVSLQVTWVKNPTVGCHYFQPGLQLPPWPLRGLLPILLLGNKGTMGVNSLPKTITRQRRDCDLNPGPYAPEYNTLTTRLPSHPWERVVIIISLDY